MWLVLCLSSDDCTWQPILFVCCWGTPNLPAIIFLLQAFRSEPARVRSQLKKEGESERNWRKYWNANWWLSRECWEYSSVIFLLLLSCAIYAMSQCRPHMTWAPGPTTGCRALVQWLTIWNLTICLSSFELRVHLQLVATCWIHLGPDRCFLWPKHFKETLFRNDVVPARLRPCGCLKCVLSVISDMSEMYCTSLLNFPVVFQAMCSNIFISHALNSFLLTGRCFIS